MPDVERKVDGGVLVGILTDVEEVSKTLTSETPVKRTRKPKVEEDKKEE